MNPADLSAMLTAGDRAMDNVAAVIKQMAAADTGTGVAPLREIPCPGCGLPINIVSTVTRNLSPLGLPVGMADVELDLMPMAEHIAACPLIGGAA